MNAGQVERTGSTSSSLVRRAQHQDPSAWERMTELYAPLVYGWGRRAGLQASDAGDVAQEVFRTVAVRIDDFRRDHPAGSFRGWLWGITRNKLREHARRQAAGPQATGGTAANERLHSLAELSQDETPEFQQAESQTSLMHRALEVIRVEFEDRTWQAFWRSTVDEQKTADIADDLEMTPKAVRQAKYRVLRRLRQELDDLV